MSPFKDAPIQDTMATQDTQDTEDTRDTHTGTLQKESRKGPEGACSVVTSNVHVNNFSKTQ